MASNPNITIDWAQFKLDFPEFNNVSMFPESAFNFWLNLSKQLLDPMNRVSSYVKQLAELFIAHNLVLEAIPQRDMNVGGSPGVGKGSIAGKSAGDVSISYNTVATMEANAGHWNYTIYGQRFIRMARLAGAGPIQVGPGCGGGGIISFGG